MMNYDLVSDSSDCESNRSFLNLDHIESSPEFGDLEAVERNFDVASAIKLDSSVSESSSNDEAPMIIFESSRPTKMSRNAVSSFNVRMYIRQRIHARRTRLGLPSLELTASASGNKLMGNQSRLTSNKTLTLPGRTSKRQLSSCQFAPVDENEAKKPKIEKIDQHIFPAIPPPAYNAQPHNAFDFGGQPLNRSLMLTSGGLILQQNNQHQYQNVYPINIYYNDSQPQFIPEPSSYHLQYHFQNHEQYYPIVPQHQYNGQQYNNQN